MNGARIGAPQHLPTPGRDARAVLADLGYNENRITALIDAGAVGENT
jgi:crotonobetainyl-CoA:carnitine CoA-transferase CaiB-like acyl-CoA transferase